MTSWTRVCRVDDIARPGARVVRRTGAPNVAVFRTSANRVFALLDRCPHRGGPLSQGIVRDERVICPLHSTSVELESGKAIAPDKGCVESFAVRIEQDVVYVDLQNDVSAATADDRSEPDDAAVSDAPAIKPHATKRRLS